MDNYKDILLNRLHTTINHNNEIENDCIRFLSYDITIEPKIIQLEKKKSILCTVYFYVKAPLFDNVFFESSSSIASDEYKAIELSSDNFVYCALHGILDFLSGIHHHEIETSILGNKKLFTVCESPILGLGNIENSINNKEDFYNDYVGFDEKNGYSSFLWNSIYKEVPFILANNRVSFIKTYAAKMPNDDIIVECTINNIHNKTLENCVQNEIIKWDNNGEFFSPAGIAVNDQYIYVADMGNKRIQQFDLSGNYIQTIKHNLFNEPRGLSFARDGNLYIADGSKVFYYDILESDFTIFNNSERYTVTPTSVAESPNGNIYLTDFMSGRIDVYTRKEEYYANLDVFVDREYLNKFPVVVASVTVRDRAMNPVVGLTPENFFVTENSSVSHKVNFYDAPEKKLVTLL